MYIYIYIYIPVCVCVYVCVCVCLWVILHCILQHSQIDHNNCMLCVCVCVRLCVCVCVCVCIVLSRITPKKSKHITIYTQTSLHYTSIQAFL